jgi:hypothetical protein
MRARHVSVVLTALLSSYPFTSACAFRPVCTHPSAQTQVIGAARDSHVVIAWRDDRDSTNTGIFAELFDWRGNAQWTTQGTGFPIATAVNSQHDPSVALGPDGTSWLVWGDYRTCSSTQGDVYFQAISEDGLPLCVSNGLPLMTGTACNYRNRPSVVSFDAGAAIVAIHRNAGTGFGQSQNRVYVQKVTSDCERLWGAEGAEVWRSGTVNDRPGAIRTQIMSDGLGGIILVWTYDITDLVYVRRVSSTGVAMWPDAVRVCITNGVDQGNPAFASDGAGGVIVIWEQGNVGARTIRAQRIDASGVRLWGDCGKLISGSGGDLSNPKIVRSTMGRSHVIWQANFGTADSDVFAQRINLLGDTLAARIALGTMPQRQLGASIAARGDGGSLIAWEDRRDEGLGENGDIYVQRLDADGNELCSPQGELFIAEYPSRQSSPVVLSTTFGGSDVASAGTAAVIWTDERFGSLDVLAQGATDECPPLVLDAESSVLFAQPQMRAFPNPSYGQTMIEIGFVGSLDADVWITDVLGRKVRSLWRGATGQVTRIAWDGLDDEGRMVPAGAYFAIGRADSRLVRTLLLRLR